MHCLNLFILALFVTVAALADTNCNVSGDIRLTDIKNFSSSCIVPSNSMLRFVGGGDGANETSAVTALLEDTEVGAGGAVVIKGESPSSVPLVVRIVNVAFELDAVLHITGAFPPQSQILVSGCTFHVESVNSVMSSLGPNIVAIAIGLAGETVSFGAFSTIRLVRNNITAVAASREVVGIGFRTQVTVRDNVTLEVSQNIINITGGSSIDWGAAIDFWQFYFVQGNGSRLIVDSNTITGFYSSAIVMPYVFATADSCECTGDSTTFVSMSRNTALLNRITNDYSSLYLHMLVLTAGSVVEVLDNRLTARNMDAYLELHDDLLLEENSTVVIGGNSLISFNGNPEVYVAAAVRVRDRSQLIFSGNRVFRGDDQPAAFPYFYFNSDLEVANNGSLRIYNNTADYALRTMPLQGNATAPPRVTPGFLTITRGYTENNIFFPVIIGVDPGAVFLFCFNTYVGVPIDSSTRLRASVSTGLYNVITPFSSCGDDPILQTRPSATDPSGASHVSIATPLIFLLLAFLPAIFSEGYF